MFNIRHRTKPLSTIARRTLLLLLVGSLASTPSLYAPSFSQQENDGDDDTPLILSGRINSMLMPTMTDTSNDDMNNFMVMPQMMNNSSTSPVTNDSAASRAMRYSMARDVAWLLSGDWVLASNSNNDNSSNSTTFDAEFIKVSTNGTMLHTHRITNFVPLTNASDIAAFFNSNTNARSMIGKADVYFNDELAWSQVDTNLSIMNGTVLMIDIDSEDIDDHFHDQPIYGTVNMLSKDDGITITLPTPRSIQEKIEQGLAELGVNTTQAQSAIEGRATQVERTFEEEAMKVFNNITNSIRDIIARE